jgi:Helix-turn-helix domain
MADSAPRPRPLAAASVRLRRRPGRPPAQSPAACQADARANPATPVRASAAGVSAVCLPRLLDLDAAAAYLAVSPWTVRDLWAAGRLPRIRLPLAGDRQVRKLLFAREDLDRLIDDAKEP